MAAEKVRVEGVVRVRVEPAPLPAPYIELKTGTRLAIGEDEAAAVFGFLADPDRPPCIALASVNAVIRTNEIAALFVEDLLAVAKTVAEAPAKTDTIAVAVTA